MLGTGKYEADRKGLALWKVYINGGSSSGNDRGGVTKTVGRGRRKLNSRVDCGADLMARVTTAALGVLRKALSKDMG
jgi:hypothetical protein